MAIEWLLSEYAGKLSKKRQSLAVPSLAFQAGKPYARGGFRCLCRVQKYCILSNAHGDQFAHSVTDDLNIYINSFLEWERPNFNFILTE